jgi:hypothetical protein
MTPELILLFLVFVVISLGYGFIYPRFAGNDFKKVSLQDIFATAITLIVAGSLYHGSHIQFNWLGFSVNWFWYTFLTYVLIELPVCLVYAKKYNMKFK